MLPSANSRTKRFRRLSLCCTALVALAAAAAGHAQETAGLTISVGEPPGFAALTDEQSLIVDVYFGRVRRGEARITATPGAIAFADPAAVLDLLPGVKDRDAVMAALGAPRVPANSQLACALASDPAACGRLQPEVAGVIFDRNNFRVDVFLNPTFLEVEDDLSDKYLPEPEAGPSLINAFGAVVSGRFGKGDTIYNFHDSLTVGLGAGRLRADLAYATGYGFQADRLAVEWDRPGLRYLAGALWAPGNQLTGRRKLIGAGIESQIDTRRDKDEMLGNPIVVYLDQRARIDVIRDGRVISSAVYEAGNQQIDTSGFPDGSYDVVLRIDEPGRPLREDRRFFSKSQQIPSLGRSDFYAFAGFEVDPLERGSLEPSGNPYLQGGIIHRLSENWALAGGLEAGETGGSVELAANFLTDIAHVRAAAVADLDGGYGGVLQLASSGASRLNFNFDLRHIERSGPASGAADALPSVPGAGTGSYGGTYSQVGGLVSYSLDSFRVLATLLYRDDDTAAERYSIGSSVEWDVMRSGPFVLTLRGDITATERGEAGFAGLSLRMFGGNSTVTALAGARTSGISGDDLGEGPVAALAGAWSPGFAGGDLALGAGIEHQPNQRNATASAEYHHRLASLSGDIVHSNSGSHSATQYALGFQSSFAAGAGVTRVAGRTTSDSLVVAQVEGAGDQDAFEVLVNEQVAGTILGTAPLTLALPPYRAYNLRIRPTSAGLLAYDSSPREVGLYPGSVAKISWTSAPIMIRIGRLMLPDGTPARRATITSKGVWSETDEEGYFQVEAPADATFEVALSDGRTFAMTLPHGRPQDGIARLEPVTCCEQNEVLLGSLGDFRALAQGERK